MHMPDGVREGGEKNIYILLALLGLVVIGVLVMWLVSYTQTHAPHAQDEPVRMAQTTPSQGETTDAATDEASFEAILLEVGENKTFIRASIKEKGVFSIGINDNTAITKAGASVDVNTLEPLAQLSITALPLSGTEQYDFLARSIAITGTQSVSEPVKAGSSKEELEAKSKQLIESGAIHER